MKKFKTKLLLGLLTFTLFSGVTTANSSRVIGRYSFTLPRFGKPLYTSSIEKKNQSRAVNNNVRIGGNYNLFSRVVWNGQNITKEGKQKSGERIFLQYYAPHNNVKSKVQLKLNSHWSDYVKININGTWSPDEK